MNNKILYLRNRYNIKQLDIAYFLNIARRTYSDIEGEQIVGIKIKHYILLALLYNVSLEYLIGITEKKGIFPNEKTKIIIKKYSVDVVALNMLRRLIGAQPVILENNQNSSISYSITHK